MRLVLRAETLLIVTLIALLTAFPLLDYGLRESTPAAIAGGILGLLGLAMPTVARVVCPMPDETRGADEHARS